MNAKCVITSYSIHYTKLYDVAVANKTVFLANGQSGLFVIDVANPAAPRAIAMLDTPGYAQGVSVYGGLVYVADQVGGVRIIGGVPGQPDPDNDGDLRNNFV